MATPLQEHFDVNRLVKAIKGYLPSFDKKVFCAALEFATEAHEGQLRKDEKTPYIVHPLKTAEILTHLHAPQDLILAAILHDVPEDTKYDIHDVRQRFGTNVAFLVEGITKLSKVHYKNNMPERQVESLKKLFLHSVKDVAVIIVKLADRLHNMSTLQFVNPEKRIRIAGETLEIFVPIANLLGIQFIKCQLEDYCFMYLFPTEYQKLKKSFEDINEKQKPKLKKFINKIDASLKTSGIKYEIVERQQSLYTVYKKLLSSGKTMDEVSDRINIRIIVESIPECYEALGVVHGLFLPNSSKFKDYIANPKINKYQSLHTMVFGIDGTLSEVQIRTKSMHLEARFGIAANFFVDPSSNTKMSKDTRSAWVDKIVEIDQTGRSSDSFMEDLKHDIFQERIFVFTPDGRKIDLPRGASAVDLAYCMSEAIGNSASKAEISGSLFPITTALKNGDVVSIVTSDQVRPSISWLSFVKTSHARKCILSFLKKHDDTKKVTIGRNLLQKELDIAGLGLLKNADFKKIRVFCREKFHKNIQSQGELYTALAEGEIKAVEVSKALKKTPKRDIDGIKVTVKVLASNRFGLLKDISAPFYQHSIDMISLKAWASHKLKDAYFYVQFVVKDLEDVGHIFDELEQIEDVKAVYRIPTSKLLLSYILIFITGIIWLSAPFVLKFLISIDLLNNNDLIADLITYSGAFSLLIMSIYITTLIKNHVPYARNKTPFWVVAFAIPIAWTMLVFLELGYLKIRQNFLVLVFELVVIYFYLVKSFWELRKYS